MVVKKTKKILNKINKKTKKNEERVGGFLGLKNPFKNSLLQSIFALCFN